MNTLTVFVLYIAGIFCHSYFFGDPPYVRNALIAAINIGGFLLCLKFWERFYKE